MTKGIVDNFMRNILVGRFTIKPEEIKEACFVELNDLNIDEYLVRPHMKSRTIDAMRKKDTYSL